MGATPERIGQYQVRRALGRGGMGIVYEAIHPLLGKRVAIKVLHAKLAGDASLVERFLREGRAAARIRHAHVVDVTDVGTADGAPYLVMELLEGEPLSAVVSREAPLPPQLVAEILLPVCSALLAAHAEGVLHRDLKPENIFLARAPQGGLHPKVVDFGIAKVHGEEGGKTHPRSIMGTPYYMALEQIRDPSAVDARVDQYALGVIAYECLTGRVPFPGPNTAAVVTAAAIDTPPSPRSLVPSIPEPLEAAVVRAMAREPEDRFPSVREVGVALLPYAGPKARMHWAPQFTGASIPPPPLSEEGHRDSSPSRPGRAPGPPRILLVEDDPGILENLVELLECEGFEPIPCSTGEEGVARAAEAGPDLVLCDVSLPGMDGHAVLKALRASPRTRHTPFIFLSARAERGDVRAGMNLGADDYITKPFARAELLEAVRTRLARFGLDDTTSGEGFAPTLLSRDE